MALTEIVRIIKIITTREIYRLYLEVNKKYGETRCGAQAIWYKQ